MNIGTIDWTTILSYIGLAYVVLTAAAAFFSALASGFEKFWPGGASFFGRIASICGTIAGALHTIPVGRLANGAKKVVPMLLLVFGFGATQLGCPSLLPIVTQILAYGDDAQAVLNIISIIEKTFFGSAPNAELQRQIEQKLLEAQLALDIAVRSLNGAKDLSGEQVDSAFAEFRKAYESLVDLLKLAGIISPTPEGGAYMTARGQRIPTPLAMGKVVAR